MAIKVRTSDYVKDFRNKITQEIGYESLEQECMPKYGQRMLKAGSDRRL